MRTVAKVLAVLALAAGLSVVAPTPANAATAVCTGVWRMNTSTPLDLGSRTATFQMFDDLATCVPPHSADATGTLAGSCIGVIGNGVMGGHHNFVFQSVGSVMVFSGGVVGAMMMAADPNTGGSCLTGTRYFLLVGVIFLV